MTKMFEIFLIMVFVLMSPISVFAANASFSDVPTGNWAYGAVSKLAQDGLIDGFGDSTFRGDKPMSRYEFAVLIAKSLDKYEKASADNKKLIDSLSAEFASELNHMDVRLAKVEAKTNIWIGGDTRMRWITDSPGPSSIKKLHGSDSFDFRQRIKFWGTINDDMMWSGRIATNAQNKWGNYDQTSGSDISLDVMNVTMKKALGLDSIRLGRSPVDFFTYSGLIGRPNNADGITINNKFGDYQFTGWVGNVKTNTNQGNASGDSGDANTLTTAQVGFKVADRLNAKTGYYWADFKGTSTATGTGTLNTNVGSFTGSKGWYLGFDYKLGSSTILADYMSTTLDNAVGLPSNPKGWAVQISNGKGPGATKVFYPALPFVEIGKAGDSAWLVGYRSIDPGTVPGGIGGFDTTAVGYASQGYNVYTHGTDNVRALYLAYENVLAKNCVLSLEYQDIKLKNRALTGLTTNDLDKTFQVKFEFFY
jgi:S-layer homology domain.